MDRSQARDLELMQTVGLLHPGEMGQTVGASARAGGARVLWASDGRSEATVARAASAGLDDAGSLEKLVAESDCVVVVCPPASATDVAERVAAQRFTGTYVDANAIAPASARRVARIVTGAGARFVDGGIVGPPAHQPGSTRLYLSGAGAEDVAAVFHAGPLEAIPIDGEAGSASALKLAYAAYTKGSAALLLAVRAFARHEGVDASLLAEWTRSIPHLPAQSEGAARGTSRKAWRFVGEMNEIASAFETAGLPRGFHAAASELYERLVDFRGAEKPPELNKVLDKLRGN